MEVILKRRPETECKEVVIEEPTLGQILSAVNNSKKSGDFDLTAAFFMLANQCIFFDGERKKAEEFESLGAGFFIQLGLSLWPEYGEIFTGLLQGLVQAPDGD